MRERPGLAIFDAFCRSLSFSADLSAERYNDLYRELIRCSSTSRLNVDLHGGISPRTRLSLMMFLFMVNLSNS